jgi:hypothetical protein
MQILHKCCKVVYLESTLLCHLFSESRDILVQWLGCRLDDPEFKSWQQQRFCLDRVHNGCGATQPPIQWILRTTNSIKQGSSYEAKRSSATQKIPYIFWNSKVHYRIHKRPSPVRTHSQINWDMPPNPTVWRFIFWSVSNIAKSERLLSWCLYVCPHGTTRLPQDGFFFYLCKIVYNSCFTTRYSTGYLQR